MTLKFDGCLEKEGTFPVLHQALCIIWSPLVNIKQELQSRKAQFGPTLAICCPVWPWNLMDDLEKNNSAPLLCYFNLCKSFQSHWWIQTGVTVLKRSIRLKITHICPLWPWNLTDDLKKQQGTSSVLHQDLSIISQPYVNSNRSYSLKNPNLGQNQ